MIVHVDCPDCLMEKSFEMAQYSEKFYTGSGVDDFNVIVRWDINLQKCECNVTPGMEEQLDALADEQAISLSFDDSGEGW